VEEHTIHPLMPVTRFLRALRPAQRRPSRPAWSSIEVDGKQVQALPGQSVAAALIQAGIWQCRLHPISGEPRGPYCGMGVCFECELEIDGMVGTRACLVTVQPGMVINTDRTPGVE
jgi:predicted molibdopterin-dependent oxidoreductase YjgC